MIGTLIFDWGGTIMEDPGLPGPMYLWDEVSLVPGAGEALEALSAEYSCWIATGAGVSDGPMMRKALERVGVAGRFRGFFSPRELGYAKPDPEFFREVCRRAGAEPGACIMTGNDYAKDIAGAKAAGLRTIFFHKPGGEGNYPLADVLITRMQDLPGAVRRIATTKTET